MRPFYVPKGNTAKLVSEAKASLLQPSRPETPIPHICRRVILPELAKKASPYPPTARLAPEIDQNSFFTKNLQNRIDEFIKTGNEFTLQIRLCTRILILAHECSLSNLEYLDALIMDIDESAIDNEMLQTILRVAQHESLQLLTSQFAHISVFYSILKQLTCLDIPAASFATVFNSLASNLHSLATINAPEELVVSCANDVLLIFRNISSKRSGKSLFVSQISQSAIKTMCTLIAKNSIFRKHDTIMLNISRVLSKLCSNVACMAEMNNTQTVESLIEVLSEKAHNIQLVTRICYVLGFMTNSVSLAHPILARNLHVIEKLIQMYYQKYTNEPKNQEIQDCLLRIVRLISNASLDKTIGAKIVQSERVADIFNLLSEADSNENELALNTLACVANLSFYINTHAIKEQELLGAGPLLFSRLMSSNEEIVIESLRTIANLFRIRTLDFSKLLPCKPNLYSYGHACFAVGSSELSSSLPRYWRHYQYYKRFR